MTAKANSKSCQTSEMELSPRVVTGFRGERRILSNILDEAFCENSRKRKTVHYFCKTSILDVWRGSEYASEERIHKFLNLTLRSLWPTKYTALYVTFWRPKLRGQFSENLGLWIYEFLFNSDDRISKEKNYESSSFCSYWAKE